MQRSQRKQVSALFRNAPVLALSMAFLAGNVEARDSRDVNAGLAGQFWYSLDGDYYK